MPPIQRRTTGLVPLLRKAAAISRKQADMSRERAAVLREVARVFTRDAEEEPEVHWSDAMRRHADAARLQAHALDREARTAELEAAQYESRADAEAIPRRAARDAGSSRAAARSAGPRPRRSARR